MKANTRWSIITGKDVTGATSEEAIQNAGLNWQVKQAKVSFTPELENAAPVLMPGRVVNYRGDTGAALGIVSDSYQVLQNRDAFRFLDGLMGASEAMFVNAGSFRNGAKVYIQAKLPGEMLFDDGGQDKGEKYLTFITSHDGTLPISVMFTPIRVVCQNTLNAALRNNTNRTTVKHTVNLHIGMNSAKETLGILNTQFTLLETLSKKLTHTAFNENHIPQLLEKAGMVPAITEKSGRALNIIEAVTQRYKFGMGADMESAKGTAWGAYNAVVEYVDHYRTENDLKRVESAILGSGAEIKQKAFDLLLTA